jgi:hemoglobin
VSKPDIGGRADLEVLVRDFYGRALTDPIIGFLFTDVAHLDLEAHVPVITDFWETILFGTGSYRGGAFRPHAELDRKAKLRYGHFARWLALWTLTIHDHFEGPVAEQAKTHAIRVATAFHRRLEGLPAEEPEPGDGPLLQILQIDATR